MAQFDGASETGPRDYVAFLNDVYQTGGVVAPMGYMIDPAGSKIREAMQRFQSMQGPLNTVMNRPVSEQAVNDRIALSRGIRDRLGELRALRNEVDEDIRRREREVDALVRQQ